MSVAAVTPSEITTVRPRPLRSSGRLVQPATQHRPCALEVRGTSRSSSGVAVSWVTALIVALRSYAWIIAA